MRPRLLGDVDILILFPMLLSARARPSRNYESIPVFRLRSPHLYAAGLLIRTRNRSLWDYSPAIRRHERPVLVPQA
ncbi:hypothetical protein HD554DRAFT_17872 [Boletus coccyginus]|nr:hypothetical protein HD554DRAFT_17872 [Boletus coccyginus]